MLNSPEMLEMVEQMDKFDEDTRMAIGFYTYGPKGASGEMKVEECEWVLDSNLGRREE